MEATPTGAPEVRKSVAPGGPAMSASGGLTSVSGCPATNAPGGRAAVPVNPLNIDELCRLAHEGQTSVLAQRLQTRTDTDWVDKTDKSGRSMLHWACAGGHVAITRLLIETYSADITLKDDAGWSALMISTSAGRQSIVDLLLKSSTSGICDVNSVNMTGQTALHYAASKNQLQIAEMLIGKGATVNVADHLHNTPLHRSACLGHTKLTALLLDHGAQPNRVNSQGNTPLHLACEEEREQDVHLLLKYGANLDITNKDDKTAVDLASVGLRKVLNNIRDKQQQPTERERQ